ncbi:MAG: flagellin [Anaerolineae bacterium]
MATVDFTRINTNIAALNSLNTLRDVNKALALAQTRLSTGRRINEAADDPAGLTLATKFDVRAQGMQVAMDNIGNAKNLLAVAEGGLKKINEILAKMRAKAEMAADDSLGADERTAIAEELSQYAREIDDIVNTTKWNGQTLLSGGISLNFQTSADSSTSYDYTVWTLTQAHDVQGTGTDGLGDLADVTGSSTVSISTDPDSVFSAASAGNTTFSGLEELSTGSYTIRVVIGSTDGSATDSYLQILDANGEPLWVDADGSSGGLLDTKVSFAYDASGAFTVNLGNGLEVVLNSGLTAGTKQDATFAYTKSGTYDVSTRVNSAANARAYMQTLDSAIATVSSSLSNIGSMVARLSFKEDTLAIGKVNTEAAFSRIMNADMAVEQLNAVKNQILQQSAIAMLAQANMAPQAILQLMG